MFVLSLFEYVEIKVVSQIYVMVAVCCAHARSEYFVTVAESDVHQFHAQEECHRGRGTVCHTSEYIAVLVLVVSFGGYVCAVGDKVGHQHQGGLYGY